MPAPHEGDRGAAATSSLRAILAGRLAGNLLLRFPYTFITSISHAFGVRVDTMATLLGIRELGGLAAPAVGRVADRGHERLTMLWCATAAAVATLVIALRPPIWLLVALLTVGGVAKFGLDTAQTAWIGHRVPFARQSRTFGVIESSWALALLVGIPLCGWVKSVWGWRAMFVLCGLALGIAAAAVRSSVPADRPEPSPSRPRLRISRPLAGILAYGVLQPFAQMFVFAVYGDWFRSSLGMSDARLSAASMVIGVGELLGTGLTAALADGFGKRRSATVGILVAAPLSAALGLVGGNQLAGVALIVAMAIAIEFSFVSALPLVAELDPDSRASAIGLATALITIARAASSALAGQTYVHLGIGAIGAVTAASCVGAAVALWTTVEPTSS